MNILYLCDGKACDSCRSIVKDCIYTSDINHAENFTKLGDGFFAEKPAILEAKYSLTELAKELNIMLEKYHNLRTIHFPLISNFDDQRTRIDEACKSIECAITVIALKIKDIAEVK